MERIHVFLNRVSLANTSCCATATRRFQKKLTVAFCRSTWQMLKRAAKQTSEKRIDNIALVEWSRSAFRQHMLDFMRVKAEEAQHERSPELEKDLVHMAL